MHNVSEVYKDLFANPNHKKEVKLEIAGTEYSQNSIVKVFISGGAFSTFGIGNCMSREAEFEFFQIAEIPRQAEIKVFVRLLYGEQVSEWVPKGVFFVSKRKRNKITGALQITAYDAMLKAEEIWLDASHAPASWPMVQSVAVADIADKMGVGVDPRNSLSTQFPVEYPVDEQGEYTMREVLSSIAVSNAGNWVINDVGQLRLLKIGEIPDETNLLITNRGEYIKFGEVRLVV